MKNVFVAVLLAVLVLPAAARAQSTPVHVDVFVSGTQGYHTFRIPAIETAADGSLLAFAEARKYNADDPGYGKQDIDLVLRRSTDGGKTWSPMKVIEDPGELWSAANPATVVDRQTGRVWMLYLRCKPQRSTETARPGTDDNQILARTSDDNGQTWSEPIDLTKVSRDMADPKWRTSVVGPGGMIQDRKGRLVAPFWKFEPFENFAIYSEDHGKTWQRGQMVPGHGDENQLVELADGQILMDIRQNSGPNRWMSNSGDGGKTWSKQRPGNRVSPVCCGIERFTSKAAGDDRDRILWTGPKGPDRKNLVVRVSYDEGQTFQNERPISAQFAAYSDLTVLKDKSVGVFWERGVEQGYQFLTFTRFDLSFLEPKAAEFKAGVGRVNVTPSEPMWLSGYSARTHKSEGAPLCDLWAKALVLEDAQGGRVAIVTMDLIGLPREVSDEVAGRVEKQFGLKRSQLVLNASHTHSGPAVWPGIRVMFDFNADDLRQATAYSRKLTDQLVGVVGAAIADLSPARLDVGHGTAGFAINRREPTKQGVRIGQNPKGPIDHDVPVVRITAPDGKLRAVLFGYACHNTTLGGDMYRVNGDYAGFAQIELEKALPGTTAMFMELCGADQNPSPRGKVEHAAEYGKTLAGEVGRLLAGQLRPVRPPVRTAYELIRLDFAPHDRAKFEADAKSTNRYLRGRAEWMLKAYDASRPVRQLEYPVQAVRLGDDLTLIALGGEVVVDYALRLKRELPKENLIVAGFSNDVMCYIPSRRVLREGGYEPVESMIYYGQPGPFAESVEEKVIEACGALVKRTRD